MKNVRFPRKYKKNLKSLFGNGGYAYFFNLRLEKEIDYFMDNKWKTTRGEVEVRNEHGALDAEGTMSKILSYSVDKEIFRGLIYEWNKIKKYEVA